MGGTLDTARSQILQQQLAWAAARRIAVDPKGYTNALEDNLFQPLSPATRADFVAGSGDELGTASRKGKMLALHSSSALACNVFDYWRTRDLRSVSSALGLGGPASDLRFEAKFPTGLDGMPPNLDIALQAGGATVAIECKFTEPYGASKAAEPFKAKYFSADRALWRERSLPACQQLAENLQKGAAQFQHLNAAQLLKQVLGLAQPRVGAFMLVYLWYALPGAESEAHAADLAAFASAIGTEFQFRPVTFQALFGKMRETLKPEDAPWAAYLSSRYFGG